MSGRGETVHKVTAFITRTAGLERQLLVFQHPSAGLQLPAGTVEQDELIEAAVLREVAEETGLIDTEIIARLETIPEPLGPEGRMVTRRVLLRSEPGDAGPGIEWRVGRAHVVKELGRGLKVRQMRDEAGDIIRDGYAQIGYDLYDIRGPHDWVLLQTPVAWVPLDAITTEVQRHLFHLRVSAPTPDRWTHDGDARGCELRWVPLAPEVGLVRGHDTLLRRVLEQLRLRSRGRRDRLGRGRPERRPAHPGR